MELIFKQREGYNDTDSVRGAIFHVEKHYVKLSNLVFLNGNRP